MYKKHKTAVVVVMLSVTAISWIFQFDYENISEIAITVVSIAFAVYIGAISAILGSPYAKRLRSIRDQEIRTKTLLGVFSGYLRTAVLFCILTISTSCLYIFRFGNRLLFQFPILEKIYPALGRFACSVSCGLLGINILFMWLVFKFLIVSLSNSAEYGDE